MASISHGPDNVLTHSLSSLSVSIIITVLCAVIVTIYNPVYYLKVYLKAVTVHYGTVL